MLERRGAAIRAEAARQIARVAANHEPLTRLYGEWQRAPATRDAALLRALVTGALRWHHRLEWQLGQLLDRPLPPKEATLAALLRAGLLQLQDMRIPEHAAGAATVEAASLIGRKHAKGLINAVLRNFQRERDGLAQRMRTVPAASYSHPLWLIERLETDWPDAATRIFEANNQQAPLTLRVNRTRTELEDYLRELDTHGMAYRRHDDVPFAVELLAAQAADSLPGYADGRVSIQDLNAQRAVALLGLEAGQRVLDACAAPGGKTAQIRELCPAVDELVAVDVDAARIATMRANLQRLGVDATVVRADLTRDEWWDGRAFDRILLDAPCTAVGVIRRHPDIKLRRVPADVDRAVATQQALLRRVWPMLASGGRLVYVTCSVLRVETDSQIRFFAEKHDDAALESEEWRLPGEANGDGFYYACLIRR